MLSTMVKRVAMAPSRFQQVSVNGIMRFSTEVAGEAAPKLKLRILEPISRATRKQLRQEAGSGSSQVHKISKARLLTRTVVASSIISTLAWHFALDQETKDRIRNQVGKSFIGKGYDYLVVQVKEICKPFTEPSRDKLLPDWPMPGYGIPEGYPARPTLVLGVEDVLLHSEWDRKFGWRHAKRPHVDEFLEAMALHYEIVLFSGESAGLAEEVLMKLDKKRCAFHYLFRDSTHFYNGAHVKDIKNINRDIKKVILVDSNPENYQLQPENAIPISPYVDGKDRNDTTLKELMPFLIALAEEKIPDFTKIISEFQDSDGIVRDLPSKYQARVMAIADKKKQEKSKGLGGFVRNRVSQRAANPNNAAFNSSLPKF